MCILTSRIYACHTRLGTADTCVSASCGKTCRIGCVPDAPRIWFRCSIGRLGERRGCCAGECGEGGEGKDVRKGVRKTAEGDCRGAAVERRLSVVWPWCQCVWCILMLSILRSPALAEVSLGIGILGEERFCGVSFLEMPHCRSRTTSIDRRWASSQTLHLQGPAFAAVHTLRSPRNRRSPASRLLDETGPVKSCPPPALVSAQYRPSYLLLPGWGTFRRLPNRYRHQMPLTHEPIP
jgi:hypothetical protein